jgi:hypothetical protein
MSREEDPLTSLLRAARPAPEPTRDAPPFGFETAVLSAWRASWRDPSPFQEFARALRFAAIVGCALALAGATWERRELARFADFTQPENNLADSAVALSLTHELSD